ncbi:hypothetical protein C2W62_41195 [Candidatus Entotheonella serta]|nr:hypothetical protein C2W62_41195 [Candidatus Entotheonella serta]
MMHSINFNWKYCICTPVGLHPFVWMALTLVWLLYLAVQARALPAAPTWAPQRQHVAVKSRSLPFEAKLAPGTFLVASRRLRDPNFSKTVILLVAYNEDGAQGVIINRPSPIRVSQALPKLPESKSPSPYIYLGGPVAPTQMRILVQTDEPSEDMQRVLDNVYLSGSPDVLQALLKQTEPASPFRTFAGYAGWAPGQLEREIERGSWHIFKAYMKAIFDPAPGSIWTRLIRQRDLKWM